MCDKYGCILCSKIKRNVHTPDVLVDGYNLRDEVLRWTDLPVPNRSDPDHFYSAPEARRYIDDNNVSFEKLKSFIPNTKEASEEKKAVNQSKLLDKGNFFSETKLRATIGCDNCGAERGFYSDFGVGTKKGPSKAQLNSLVASLDNGYIYMAM